MNKPYETVSQIMAERDALRAELAALKAWQGEAVAYAYEYGKDNGDGSFSVTITRGQIPSYLTPVKDWPVKPLYLSLPASADAVSVPTEWRDMLEELQWQHRDADDYYHKPAGFYCPICGSGAADGHISNCRIRALLAQSESKG